MLFAGIWGAVWGFQCAYAEDIKKPLLQLPQVTIVGEKSNPQLFADGEVKPDTHAYPNEAESSALEKESSGFVNVSYGRFDTRLLEVKHSERTPSFYYTGQLDINSSDGERANSAFTTYRPGLQLGMPVGEENGVVFITDYFDKIMELPGPVDAPTGDAKRRNTDLKMSLMAHHAEGDTRVNIAPYYEFSLMDNDIVPADFRHKVAGIRADIEADGNVVNVDLYQNRLMDIYDEVILDSKIRVRPLEFNDQWSLVIGANIFSQEMFGQRPSPFAELIFKENDECLHKLVVTRECAPIVFSRMYLDESYVEVNPERMRPVRTTSIAYQLDWNVSREWRTNVLVYVSQDKDMWFWGDRDANGLYTPEVIEKVNIGGLKIATEYNWSEAFSHFFSLNLRNIQSEDVRYEFVPYEPKQKISLGITYRFTPRVKMYVAGDYFGRRYYTGDSRESSAGYFQLGSKLTYEAKDYLTFFVLIDNLLNDHYEIVKGYPNQGRNALSGVMIRF